MSFQAVPVSPPAHSSPRRSAKAIVSLAAAGWPSGTANTSASRHSSRCSSAGSRGRGAWSYSSARTMSTSPSRSAGSAVSASACTSSQCRSGMALLERAERRDHERVRGGLEGRDPHAARTRRPPRSRGRPRPPPAGRSPRRRGSTSRRPASVSCTPRPTRSISRTPASRSSAASCWETADGRVGERLGDRGDRAPRGQLAQQPQAADVEHLSPDRTDHAAELTGCMQKMSLDLNGHPGRHCAHDLPRLPLTSSPPGPSTPERLTRLAALDETEP